MDGVSLIFFVCSGGGRAGGLRLEGDDRGRAPSPVTEPAMVTTGDGEPDLAATRLYPCRFASLLGPSSTLAMVAVGTLSRSVHTE